MSISCIYVKQSLMQLLEDNQNRTTYNTIIQLHRNKHTFQVHIYVDASRCDGESTDYLFTAISGVNSKDHILPVCSKGGVAILYKKRIGNKVKPIISLNRRICGIFINFTPSFRCLLLSIYLPLHTVIIM